MFSLDESGRNKSDDDHHNGDRIDEDFPDSIGSAVRLDSGAVDSTTMRNMPWEPVTQDFYADPTAYEDTTTVQGGPVPGVAAVSDNPVSLFFSYFPQSSWKKMATKSNRYEC